MKPWTGPTSGDPDLDLESGGIDMGSTLSRHQARVPEAREVRAFAAHCNVESQYSLMDTLLAAAADSGDTVEDIAIRLGADPELVDAMLTGKRDINLNELRMLASAMSVIVDYRVVPAAFEWHRREQDRAAAKVARVLRHTSSYKLADRNNVRAALRNGGDDALHV